jgi:hypothetical protein
MGVGVVRARVGAIREEERRKRRVDLRLWLGHFIAGAGSNLLLEQTNPCP